MALQLTVPSQYGFVLMAATSTFFVSTVHGFLGGKYRKKAGVKYPETYASTEQAAKDQSAYQFNCAQRAHANFTENHTSFVGAVLIAGLRYPSAATYLGAAWTIARLFYAFGYINKGPTGRSVGAITGSLIDMSTKLTALYAATMFALYP